MSETQNFNISLTLDEAEQLHGTLTKHSSAVVMEKIQRQILDALEHKNAENDDYYVAKYGQPDLFTNNEK
jgi:hypothetical protein